jgi:hypothetical protein
MKLTLRYATRDGDRREVSTNVATIVKWERLMRRKVSSISEGIGAEDLCFFAYEATRQSGIVVPATLDQFIESLEDMPEVAETDSGNPTDPAKLVTS